MLWLRLQVKKLKAQLEQKTMKTQKNGTESSSSPDGEILENGTDPNIIELQSKNRVWLKAAFWCFFCSSVTHENVCESFQEIQTGKLVT